MRFGGDTNTRIKRVCSCGGWSSNERREFKDHLAEVVVAASKDYLMDAIGAGYDQMPESSDAQVCRRAGFGDAYHLVRDIFDGCSCKPGLIGEWGCQVDGHDASDGDLE
jgi:hypothetical protein